MPEHKPADPSKQGRRHRGEVRAVTSRADEQGTLAPASSPGIAARGAIDSQAARLGDPRLPPAQRLALAAEIARLQGNRHLPRALHPQHAGLPGSSISRQATEGEATAEPAPPTFQPRVMVVLPSDDSISVGDEHRQEFAIINASEAPAGTVFGWASMFTGDKLDAVNTPTPRQREHHELRVRGMAPGSTTVEAWLQYEVPGQTPGETEVSTETVTVNTPTVEMTYLTRESPDGEPLEGVERMRVGEYLRVRTFVGNVSRTYLPLPVNAQITGIGLVDLPGGGGAVGALSLQRAQVAAPGEYEFLFRADRIGHASLTIIPLPGRTPPGAVTGAVTVDTHVEMGKEEFLSLCNQVNTRIDAADRAARAWLASLCLAYGKAYKDHTDTLRDEEVSERLAADLILGAALAFVPGGIGGIIGNSMRAAQAGDFLIDGVKDLAKYGMRTAGTAGAGTRGGAGLRAFPTDPLAWRGLEEVRISSELLVATNQLLEWQDRANRNDPDFFLDFNPVERMERSLTIRDKRVSELQPVDQEETASSFEKGMWAAWLKEYGYRLVATVIARTGGLVHYRVERNVGKKIKRRCQALGVDVERYARMAEERVRARAAELNVVP